MSDEVESLALEGARRFARWDDGYFRGLAELALAIAHPPARAAWLRLAAEGIGMERLGPSRKGVLQHLLIERVRALNALPPREQTRWLARAWNLAESLTAEPEWLEAYVHASLHGIDDIARLEPSLVALVGPVVEPTRPATWTGPIQMSPLDPRGVDAEFLPGAFEPIAPRVVAVRDRLRDVSLALVLGSGGCRIFPLRQVPPRWSAADAAPTARFDEGRLTVASLTAPVATVKRAQAVCAMPSGAVVLAATDSQFLWVGSSP